MKRKWLVGILAIAMTATFGVTACSGTDDGSNSSGNSTLSGNSSSEVSSLIEDSSSEEIVGSSSEEIVDSSSEEISSEESSENEYPEDYYTEGLVFTLQDDDTYAVTGYTGTAAEVVIPSIYNGKAVTSIGEGAFAYRYGLAEIIIPDSVTSIGTFAFAGCFDLTEIVIPSSVVYIGAGAFVESSSLIILCEMENQPSSWDVYWNAEFCPVFYNCRGLQSRIKDGLKYLGNSNNPYMYLVTTETDDITSATIENGCEVIADRAFEDCSDLTEIIIPGSVTSIGVGAFYYCSSLTEIVIPDSVTSIDYVAFSNCDSLTDIIVGENNTEYKSIDGNLYSKDGKTLIQYAIGKTGTSFTIPNGVTSIGVETFSDCSNLTEIVIPDSVTSIGDWAFSDCDSLTEIVIPDSVTSIGEYAFSECYNLTEIIVPNSVTSIGECAFECCSNLTIYCEMESQPSGWDISWNNIDQDSSTQFPVVWGYTGE